MRVRWVRGTCKGRPCWVAVDEATGRPVVRGGLVPVRYQPHEDARIYHARAANVAVGAAAGGGGRARPGAARRRGSGFGKAGRRSRAQAAAAREAARELLERLPPDAVVCFTDGASSGNPGPTGAGAVVRLPGGRRVERHLALGTSTNNAAELAAVELALDALDDLGLPRDVEVHVLTDSEYVQGLLARGWKARAHREVVERLRRRIAERGARVHWIAGHAGVEDNERADALASLGVEESRLRRARAGRCS